MNGLRRLLWRFFTWKEGNRFSIGVFGAIFNEEDKLLLVRQRGRDKWGLPGGGVTKTDCSQAGDAYILRHAASRELREELGLLPSHILRFSSLMNFISGKLRDVAVVYILELAEDARIKPSSEIDEIRYIDKEELGRLPLVGPRMERMIVWAFEQKTALG